MMPTTCEPQSRSSRWPWRGTLAIIALLTALAPCLGVTAQAAGDPDPDRLVADPGSPLLASGFSPCTETVTLVVGDAPGEPGATAVPLSVSLSNFVPIRGVQMEIAELPEALSAAGCNSLVPDFDCAVVDSGGTASIDLASTVGATLAAAPIRPILELLYDVAPGAPLGTVTLTAQNVTVLDDEDQLCPATGISGAFGVHVCGNGTLEGLEECEDGNVLPGDCCSAACVFEPEGSVCDDGLFCTVDSCDGAGTCGTAPRDCDEGVGCTVDTCDEEMDSCLHAADDARCDNGSICDGLETCDPLADCLPGVPVDCDDGDLCTDDLCEEPAGTCDNVFDSTNAPECALCGNGVLDPGEACDDGNVVGGDCCSAECDLEAVGSPCDDGDFCTIADVCGGLGACEGGGARDCDDGVGCTVDTCEANACSNVPDDASCDNGLYCDGAETCDPVSDCRTGSPVVCSPDGDVCTDDICDEETDACYVFDPGNPGCVPCGNGFLNPGEACDDGNTADGDCCSSACGFEAAGAPCDDGQFCTVSDSCDGAGSCDSIPNDCDDGEICTDDFCNEGVDVCVNIFDGDNDPDCGTCGNGEIDAGEDCDDGNLVDGDCCSAGCLFEAAGSSCDDGLFCTSESACDDAGTCLGTAFDTCDDGDECTVDQCNDFSDTCQNIPFCECGNGVVDPDEACDDGNFLDGDCCSSTCTLEPQGASCDDGQFCTVDNVCDDSGICLAGTARDCDDADVCTDDVCSEGADACINTFDSTNAPECAICGNGILDPGEDCDDTNVEDGDCCSSLCAFEPPGSICDDGDFCSIDDACDGTGGCAAAGSRDCDDGDVCTDDSCNEIDDVCENVLDGSNAPECAGTTCVNPPAGDADCDGIPDATDPCPDETLNRCAGPLAICGDDPLGDPNCTSNEPIRLDLGPSAPTTVCNGESWTAEVGGDLGGSFAGNVEADAASVTTLFGCTDAATEAMVLAGRFANPIVRSYPIPDGTYVVNLLLTESFLGGCEPADRTCDIDVEGLRVYGGPEVGDGLDVYSAALAQNGEGCGSLIVRSAVVPVIDGALDIALTEDDPAFGGGACALRAVELVVVTSGCATDAECDDGDVCTDDTCEIAAGSCTNVYDATNAPECAICGDGLLDPLIEECDDGNIADGDCCSAICLFEPAASPCDDGLFCTVDEACDGAGFCQGAALDCDDGDVCTNDVCSEEADVCVGVSGEPVPEMSGSVEGVGANVVICRNNTTGQRVTMFKIGAEAWDCLDAGLVSSPGDDIDQFTRGSATCPNGDPCAIAGQVTGTIPTLALCRNDVSGQLVVINLNDSASPVGAADAPISMMDDTDPIPSADILLAGSPPLLPDGFTPITIATAWNCTDAGLIAADGERVAQFVRGSAIVDGPLDDCTADFEDCCPDEQAQCGARFVGGQGCVVAGLPFCYDSGTVAYEVQPGVPLAITLFGDASSLEVFFAAAGAGEGQMLFLAEDGTQVDEPLMTNGDCLATMPSRQTVIFSRPVRSISVEALGGNAVYLDSFRVNPP
jgi:cysteine-rich repeat protein